MDIQSLKQVIRPIADRHSFLHKGSVYWQVGQDSVVLIVEIQSSNYDYGKYINIGVMPSSFMIRPRPLISAYWPLRLRASRIESPYKTMYDSMELDGEDNLYAHDYTEAIEWAFRWLIDTWGSYYKLRALHTSSEWEHRIYASIVFVDWMEGKLRDISEYHDTIA